jgi:uncharacterized DUF497 family protein
MRHCSIWMKPMSRMFEATASNPTRRKKPYWIPGRVSAPAYNIRGERRWALLGATEPGDFLFVVYTRRHGRIRVVTARVASDREKRRYRTQGKWLWAVEPSHVG